MKIKKKKDYEKKDIQLPQLTPEDLWSRDGPSELLQVQTKILNSTYLH